ncbi:helix-turn-helix domain-containing protein [Actinokineospora sp. PR83]|uniref:helix-turn-helix domain-containing protein n=1 Tax=Actinokineospora sp. PR83 TaxID=2884908 RepID=UPI0027E17E6B|nr:helix-turn-helix transcriptional regulator [Actinokineospora sp. PR83]MCG8915471.1 helix-turn-helix domain-containing protein [Actinokineospora sp. PR83]
MSEGTTGSTVPRRQLGRYLRDLRGKARLTVRAAAEALEWSEAKIWRIETGQTSLRSLDAEAMCKVYGAPPEATGSLKELAKETKSKGWWHAFGDVLTNDFNLYVGLEEAASSLHWYQCELIPGLFQTPEYARVIFRGGRSDASEEVIERLVRLRVERQAILDRVTAAPDVSVVINEAILRRPIGGPVVMGLQLDRLIEFGELPNVSIRVAPFSIGLHHGALTGPFVIMRFPRYGDRDPEPPTVFVDGFTGSLYLDKPSEVGKFDQAFSGLLAQIPDEKASKSLIHQAAREFMP